MYILCIYIYKHITVYTHVCMVICISNITPVRLYRTKPSQTPVSNVRGPPAHGRGVPTTRTRRTRGKTRSRPAVLGISVGPKNGTRYTGSPSPMVKETNDLTMMMILLLLLLLLLILILILLIMKIIIMIIMIIMIRIVIMIIRVFNNNSNSKRIVPITQIVRISIISIDSIKRIMNSSYR